MPELVVTNGVFVAPAGGDDILPLTVSDLTYRAGSTTILDRVSFTLDAGGLTAIMGFNGAGKSVLLRLLHGLLAPSAGEIRWCSSLPARDLVRRQAMVFQYPVVLRRSVADNIRYALKARGAGNEPGKRVTRGDMSERLARLLDASELAPHAGRLATVLSGGERQRLALVRALATDPEILFLDEPTASLDPASAAVVERLIVGARDGGTRVVLVTQNVAQAQRLAGDVVFLHRGRVLEHTPAATFFATPGSDTARAFIDGRYPL